MMSALLDTLFAMDPAIVLAFALAGIVLNLTPGADVMFASACGLSGGWRTGIAASAGVALGATFHISLATLGISAALLAVPHAMDVIRWAGAAYLLWLAISTWTTPPLAPKSGHSGGKRQISHAIRKGFLTNALNPKVAIFIMAFLPQFLTPDAGPIWHQTVILGTLFLTTGFVIIALYGALAGVFGDILTKQAQVMNRISALIFGGLAARIILD